MIRFNTLKSAAGLERYFIERKPLEIYYSENQEFNGYWGGKAAKMLGLEGPVTEDAFRSLTRNLHPQTGEQLTPRMRADRRAGFDIEFDVPKSVSLLYAHSKDDRLMQAFRRAVWDTRDEFEESVGTRVRKNGRDEDRTTGNLVSAEIVHLTTRPEDGVSDPQMHVHLVVFNITYDPVEKTFKALQLGDVHEEAQYYQGRFHMRLAENLRQLGLQIEPTKDAFEIAGLSSRELIEKFSNRTLTINETAERLGITDPVEKAKLGALTREKKNKALTLSELEPHWWARLAPEEEAALKANKTLLRKSLVTELAREITQRGFAAEHDKSSALLGTSDEVNGTKPEKRLSQNRRTCPGPTVERDAEPNDGDWRAVELAKAHLFERNSVVSEKRLRGEAYRNWRIGDETMRGIDKVIAQMPLIRKTINGKAMVTTREIHAEEQRLIDGCEAGKGQFNAMNLCWKIQDEELNADQRRAVQHILQSRDWITAVAGLPGTGKTRLMREVKRGADAAFENLIVLTPSAAAAHEVLPKEGMTNAHTVARFLMDERLQQAAKGAVLMVDEAGLLSNPQADQLFEVAKNLNARLVLVGDAGQHHPVERGQVMSLLEKEAGMEVVRMETILRQKGLYKQVVEAVAKKNFDRGFDLLQELEWINEVPLAESAKLLARDYLNAIKFGNTAHVVAPTHAECNHVTEAIREGRKALGQLEKGVTWETLDNLSWTDAQKSDPNHYKPGMIIEMKRPVKGFERGERFEVLNARDGMVRMKRCDVWHPAVKALPLDKTRSFCVYEPRSMEICEGDKVLITGNGWSAEGTELCNGRIYEVDYIGYDGKLVLYNGQRVERTFPHLAYGYATTSYTAQGKTVDWIFVAQSAALSAHASNPEQCLVSCSRGRKGMKLYTEAIEWLKENVSRERERPMAVELGPRHQEAETRAKAAQRETLERVWEVVSAKLSAHEERLKEQLGKLAEESFAKVVPEKAELENEREIEPPEKPMELEMEM
jgi:conjugative relaxase-like TrwC/TraI family protein